MAENNTSLIMLAHRVSQLANERIDVEAGGHKLTGRQIQVLMAIKAHDGATQTKLVEATDVDRSTIADMIKRLVQFGLVQRTRTKSDARAYSVKLTAAGRRAATSGNTTLARVEKELVAGLPAKKRTELIALLDQVVSSAPAVS